VTSTRRVVVVGILATLTAPRGASAQPAARVPRVSIYSARAVKDALVAALRERGWLEGSTIAFEWHGAEGSEARIGEHLASVPADVLVMGGPHRIRAAMRATTAIPIIGVDLESDPVANRFVKTLARPGGNVTGIWMDLPELAGKQIQFLREVLPSLNRLGVVWDDRIGLPQFTELQAVSRAANISLLPAALRLTAETDSVMKRLLAERPQAIVLLTAPVVFAALPRLAELAHQSRLPSISPFSPYPASGGLMAYGPDFPALWRQLGGYVDRVLRGARTGNLPVERPSKFSLIVNLKTAKEIGLVLPQSLVLRADEVIR
jgi:putative ABC transport system substrate-binding protein